MPVSLKRSQRGLTLVELLISLVLGLAVGGAVLYVYVGTISTQNDTNTATQLEEELSAVLNLMVRDVRRAGYDASGVAYAVKPKTSGTATFSSPFGVDATHSTSSCLLYSYDSPHGSNSPNGILDSDEHFGWRLSGSAIEKSNDATSCGSGAWEAVTWTTYANITGLTFTIIPATVSVALGGRTVVVSTSDVHIGLSGQATLRGGATVSRTLQETVRVRNDHLTQL